MGESVSLPLTPPPPRLVDKSNSLMESDELKRRAEFSSHKIKKEKKEKKNGKKRKKWLNWYSLQNLLGLIYAFTVWYAGGNRLDRERKRA